MVTRVWFSINFRRQLKAATGPAHWACGRATGSPMSRAVPRNIFVFLFYFSSGGSFLLFQVTAQQKGRTGRKVITGSEKALNKIYSDSYIENTIIEIKMFKKSLMLALFLPFSLCVTFEIKMELILFHVCTRCCTI